MDTLKLLKSTTAYKIFCSDKKMQNISHANLIVCEDTIMLEKYVLGFVKTLFCESECYCDNCRNCRLIDSKRLVDLNVYPKENAKLSVSDADDIVKKVNIKPLENDIKVFVILYAENMNQQTQNKLLKTLEEPPEDTIIILGATTTYPLLSTVLSRVKRFDIPPFLDDVILNSIDYEDKEKLKVAITISNGKVGEVLKNLKEESNLELQNFCYSLLTELNTSKELYKFTTKFNKENISNIITILNKLVNSIIKYLTTGKLENFKDVINKNDNLPTVNALIYIAEKLLEAEKRLFFNGNITAVADSVCLGILEGKHKWQK